MTRNQWVGWAAIVLAGCGEVEHVAPVRAGSGDDGTTVTTIPLGIPLGTYEHCNAIATLLDHHEVEGAAVNLTVSAVGDTLHVAFDGGEVTPTGALDFTPSTPTLAYAPAGQALELVTIRPTPPPSVPPTVEATMNVGVLAFVEQTLFLSVRGEPAGATYVVSCAAPSTAAATAPIAGTPPLPPGTFAACSDETGAITVTQRDDVITAVIGDATESAQTLRFTQTGAGVARLLPDQTFSAVSFSCTNPFAGAAAAPMSQVDAVLVWQGDTLFFDVVGATSCAAQNPVATTCTRAP